ncbi:MAG: hypothetical protein D6732_27725, partial [Methanobacteriota archaeon]
MSGKQQINHVMYRRKNSMNLIRQLEGFCGHLREVKQALGKKWEHFATAIRTARLQLEGERLEEAVETLENMLQEIGRPEVLVARTRGAVRTRGGLISAYQQTPGKMNESLVGP